MSGAIAHSVFKQSAQIECSLAAATHKIEVCSVFIKHCLIKPNKYLRRIDHFQQCLESYNNHGSQQKHTNNATQKMDRMLLPITYKAVIDNKFRLRCALMMDPCWNYRCISLAVMLSTAITLQTQGRFSEGGAKGATPPSQRSGSPTGPPNEFFSECKLVRHGAMTNFTCNTIKITLQAMLMLLTEYWHHKHTIVWVRDDFIFSNHEKNKSILYLPPHVSAQVNNNTNRSQATIPDDSRTDCKAAFRHLYHSCGC